MSNKIIPRPIVKWAGGKGKLLGELWMNRPPKFDAYFEPFMGGGAFFFDLFRRDQLNRCTISDANEELMDLFGDMERLFHDIEGKSEQSISIEEQRELLENVLRKFRHVTYWRKQQTPTGFASDGLWFKDHRHGTGKELRLPFK